MDVKTEETKSTAAYIALTAACLLWASSFMAMRGLVLLMPPAAVVWMRSAVALALTLPIRRLWKPANYRRGDAPAIALLVLLQPCLYFLLEANALRLTTSTQAGVVSAVVPVLVAALAAPFLGERIDRRKAVGLGLSVLGVAAMSFAGGGGGEAINAPLGNLMEFAAMICAAANLILLKRLSGRYGPWTIAAYQAAAGFLFFLPAAPQAVSFLSSGPGTGNVLKIVYLGGFVTLGAFGLYNVGQGRVEASRAAAFINMVPVLATILGWAVLGESLGLLQTAAASIVVAGVRIGQGGRKKSEV
jgi:drug/metabolite transporter (DMT)-like permease